MKNRNYFKAFIIFVFALTFFSCSMEDKSIQQLSFLFVSANSKKETKNNSVKVSIRIKDFDENCLSRTLIPESFKPADFTSFILRATCLSADSDDQNFTKQWSSYSEMISEEFEILPAEWNFTLEAMMQDNGLSVVAATDSCTKTLASGTDNTLVFKLSIIPFANGKFNIKIRYPSGKNPYVSAELLTADSTGVLNVLANLSPSGLTENESGTSEAVFSKNELSSGYYYLKTKFSYTEGGAPFCVKLLHMRVGAFREINSVIEYENINTPYAIIYEGTNFADVTWNPSVEVVREFNPVDEIILPAAETISRLHYSFGGWYLDSELTKPVTKLNSGEYNRDVTLYAKWIPDVYSVTYNDWANGGTTGKDFSGKVEALPVSHTYDADTIIPVPETTVSAAENQVVFYGWFTDKNCTKELTKNASGDYVLKNRKHTADITLYAKWESKYVYLDPVSGNDNNTGFSKTDALKTLSKARSGLAVIKAITDGKQLRVCNTITKPVDIVPLSNLTAPDCGNAVVMRYTKNVLINASSSVPISISNVKFDGGAVWKDNDPSKENLSEYVGENSSALIALNNNSIVATFTNCEFVNNDSPADSALIASGSNVTLDGCVFTKNKGRILSLSLINNLVITGNTSITGNSNDYDIACSNAMEKIKLGNVQVDSIYLGSLIKFELTEKLTDKHIKLDFPVSSKGKQILFNPDENDFVSSSFNQFELVGSCAENGFTIDDTGYIIGSDSGSIVPEIYKPYKIQCSATEVSSSESTDIEFKLLDSDSAVITVNSWSFKLYSYGQDKTSQASGYITANSTAGSYIVTVGPGLPPGINLQLYVSGTVGSKAYDGVFDLTVR